jgi:hypothetical protein
MTITKRTVADRIASYLRHQITQVELVGWAENALMDKRLAAAAARMKLAYVE